MAEMSDHRLSEIDRRYGAGGGYTGAPTKQELRLALIELVDEVRRERRAAKPAWLGDLGPAREALEAENRQLWERAAQADLRQVRAELRAAKLRLVLTSVLRSFTVKRRGGRMLRSRWIEAAEIERWQRVFKETEAAAEQDAVGRAEREIGIQRPGEKARQFCGFAESDVRARAAVEGAAFVERTAYRTGWRTADQESSDD